MRRSTRLGAYDLVLLEETFGDADRARRRPPRPHVVPHHARGAETPWRRSRRDPRRRDPPRAPQPADPRAAAAPRRLGRRAARRRSRADRRRALTGARPEPAQDAGASAGRRSGKSLYAERLLAAHERVTYVATAGARPDDQEWDLRVEAHRTRRPPGWRTVETVDVASVLRAATAGRGGPRRLPDALADGRPRRRRGVGGPGQGSARRGGRHHRAGGGPARDAGPGRGGVERGRAGCGPCDGVGPDLP